MVTSSRSTLTERQQARRDGLIEAGFALLATRPYEQIQVKDLADAAGVSLGTLYHYFPTKERLFAEVVVRWADSLPLNIERRPLRGETPADRLIEATQRAARAFGRQPQMARFIDVLTMSADPFAATILGRLNRATTTAYLNALTPMEQERAQAIVEVTNAVFGTAIREWSLGRATLAGVHDRLATAVGLLIPS